MKIILLKDVKKLGKANQILEVSDGYANNFLLPQKLAVAASHESLNDLKNQKRLNEKHELELQEKAKELKENLTKITLNFTLNSKNGKVFGSISSKQIVKKLKDEFDITIDKRKLQMDNAIAALGYHYVVVDLYKNSILGKIKVFIQ